jgi:UDP-N-acetylglucosamine--N-acetylmuramyl-(pentapeptide) pyrophosphoryl-undecaprenol N-acetylglucosamine transferase
MKKNSKIAIVAGGTGGHIFPAISLLEQLIIEKKEIIFFSDTRVRNIINKNKSLFKKKNVTFYSLRISKNFKDFFSFFKNFFKIFIFIKKNDPKIIVGFGGYTSIPFLLISKILFKPIILHEQNIIIGLTNKIFSPFSKKIIFGWGDKKKNKINKKFFYIRNPVRKKILNLRKKVKFITHKKRIIILIVGGSQGATILDNIIPESLHLLPNQIKKNIEVYHQCSKNNFDSVKKNYLKNKIKCTCKTFFNNLPDIMFKSQFVISRSGASTLSEISALGKPSILIPYKFAKNNHQEKNAKWLIDKGAGTMLLENELTVENLKNEIMTFIINKKKLKKMSKNSFSLGDSMSLIKLSKLIY